MKIATNSSTFATARGARTSGTNEGNNRQRKIERTAVLRLRSLTNDALADTPRVTDTRYFWTGNGKRKTVVCDWQMRLTDVFDDAGIAKGPTNAVSRRFRDTLAVKLLERGTSIESVSEPLGRKSIRVTEKHYSPWVRSRQGALEAEITQAEKPTRL